MHGSWGTLVGAVKTLLGFAAATIADLSAAAQIYLLFLNRVARIFLPVLFISLATLLLATLLPSVLQWQGVYLIAALAAGISGIVLAVATYPLMVAGEFILEKLPGTDRLLRVIGGIGQFGAFIAVGILSLPVREAPLIVPLLVLVSLGMSLLGGRAAGRRITKWYVAKGVVLIAALSLGAFFPQTESVVRFAARAVDSWMARAFARMVTPSRLTTTCEPGSSLILELPNGEVLPFRLPTGQAQVWYDIGEDGGFVLFSGPGAGELGKELQLADTDEEIQAIERWCREKTASERLADAERTALEDALRLSRLRLPKDGEVLRRDSLLQSPGMRVLSGTDTLEVLDSLSVARHSSLAFADREFEVELSEGLATVASGSAILLIGAKNDRFIISFQFHGREVVGLAPPNPPIRAGGDGEDWWYRVRGIHGRWAGFIPRQGVLPVRSYSW